MLTQNNHYKRNMKKVSFYMAVVAIAATMVSCGGKTAKSSDNDSTALADSAVTKEITTHIKELYDAIAQKKEDIHRFACQKWWDTVAAVEKKDADAAEIGFFNDDLWTQMQDTNPDHFEVRDVKFLQLDVEKGTAVVDFVLWSTIQTVHQKFQFCREDGDWRIHNIIRYFKDADGKETESDMLASMNSYLNEAQEESEELLFLPDVAHIQPEDLSDGKDNHKKYFPVWNGEEKENDQVQEIDGVLHYNLSLGYDRPLQQLFKELPGNPVDKKEVARVIIFDLNKDGHSDALICLGNYDSNDPKYYFDAYVWNVDYENFEYVENFRNIPNPRIDTSYPGIVGRRGKTRELWVWQGMNKVEKSSVKKDYY